MTNTFFVYLIYYDNKIVYVGRTHQEIEARIRQHVFKHPAVKTLDINKITKIMFTRLKSEADMFLTEIYFICKFRPILNKDDKPHDNLTIKLPEYTFFDWSSPLWDKWKSAINQKAAEVQKRNVEKNVVNKNLKLRKVTALADYKDGKISHDEYLENMEQIRKDGVRFKYEIGEISFERYKKEMGYYDVNDI